MYQSRLERWSLRCLAPAEFFEARVSIHAGGRS